MEKSMHFQPCLHGSCCSNPQIGSICISQIFDAKPPLVSRSSLTRTCRSNQNKLMIGWVHHDLYWLFGEMFVVKSQMTMHKMQGFCWVNECDYYPKLGALCSKKMQKCNQAKPTSSSVSTITNKHSSLECLEVHHSIFGEDTNLQSWKILSSCPAINANKNRVSSRKRGTRF